jgi:hypothetical protein
MKILQDLVTLLNHKNTPDWVVSQTVRNLAYSSHNDINWQEKAIADLLGQATKAIEEDDEDKLFKLEQQVVFREEQREVFCEVHALAKDAFKEVTGSDWVPPAKNTYSKKNKTATREFFKLRNVG